MTGARGMYYASKRIVTFPSKGRRARYSPEAAVSDSVCVSANGIRMGEDAGVSV